jgi:3-phenylpropionate/cinnamic acid dioxygenase small subunit
VRDLDALLNSLVNIDRDSLVAILSSEAEAAERLANSIRTRTSTQRLKRQQAVELAARINRILLFVQHDETGPYMSDTDLALCKTLERKLIIRR